MEKDWQELKVVMLEGLDALRSKKESVGDSPVGRAYVNSKMEVLETVLTFIHQRELKEDSMDKLKKSIVASVVSIEDIPQRNRHSDLTDMVLQAVELLDQKSNEMRRSGKPAPALEIDGKSIKFPHLCSKIYRMKAQGKLADTYTVRKSGEKFYLVKVG